MGHANHAAVPPKTVYNTASFTSGTATTTGNLTPKIHNLIHADNSNSQAEHFNSFVPLSGNSTVTPMPSMMVKNNSFETISKSPKEAKNYTSGVKHTKKTTKKKQANNEEKHLISTSSPEGIAAASEITPNRIASILIKEGPLPIRHLTAHLIEQVPAFGHLSLSKQRRLIMAALESGDLITGCVFEKIGWGQWEARLVSKDLVKTRIENSTPSTTISNINSSNTSIDAATDNIKEKIGSLSPPPSTGEFVTNDKKKLRSVSASVATTRRESITAHLNEYSALPTSPTLGPLGHFRKDLAHYGDIDEAIESSSSMSDDEEIEEHALNKVSNGTSFSRHSPEYDYLNTQTLYGGKQKGQNIRSPSVPSSRRPSFAGVLKPRKPRTSFNQQTLEAALDDAPMERRESRVSFSNSSNLSRQSFLRTIIPQRSNNLSSNSSHDRDDENAIVDDESESPTNSNEPRSEGSNSNYTDEEDWKSLGPSLLKRKGQHSSISTVFPSAFDPNNPKNNGKTTEELAAIALLDLKSV